MTAVVTPEMVARSHAVGEPRWSPSGRLGWLDSFDSRVDLVIAAGLGAAPAVVTASTPLTPVGGYGGGAWSWLGDDRVVVATREGAVVVLRADGSGAERVLSSEGFASAPAVSPDGRFVAFSLERDDRCDVAVVPADGSQWPRRVSDAGFAWDPVWSPDGRMLAWHEWDLPDMPWDASRIAAAEVIDGIEAGTVRVLAGGEGIGVAQPRWSPDGTRLAWLSDRSGVTNVWVGDALGRRARPLRDEPQEHGGASWGPGIRSFAWSPDSEAVAYCRNEDGFGRLVVAARRGRATREVGKAFHTSLEWGRGGLVCVRSGAKTPAQLVAYTGTELGERRVLARGPAGGFEACGLVEPMAVSWTSSGRARVHGLLWKPEGVRKPPLLAYVHGGPTDQTVAQWNATIAFWVSRGVAVLAANYRGSTGHGRTYMRGLDEQWGVVDVDDVVSGIRYACGRTGGCDAARVAVMGGSAGGFTAFLAALRHPDAVHACVSLFGVSDLEQLAKVTHRFESRYLDSLVGPLPEQRARYRERSPLTHASSLRVPTLILQGSADKVVPQGQSDAFVDAARRAGADVEYQIYDGEGHGFRSQAALVDSFRRIEAFLQRALGVGA